MGEIRTKSLSNSKEHLTLLLNAISPRSMAHCEMESACNIFLYKRSFEYAGFPAAMKDISRMNE
jgi:hypothetical protein